MQSKGIVRRILILTVVLLNIGCDQFTKDVVRSKVAPLSYIPIIKEYLILTNVENSGAMLGFGQELSPTLKIIFLQILPFTVLLILLGSILRESDWNKWLLLAFALMIGGGVGNLIDRIAYGSVIDFFQLKIAFFKTGIFNMADVSVTTGVLLILFLSLRNQKSAL